MRLFQTYASPFPTRVRLMIYADPIASRLITETREDIAQEQASTRAQASAARAAT
ncbi:MAG: hypothetical protein V4656_19930 [Pseudomonadota bacterium]